MALKFDRFVALGHILAERVDDALTDEDTAASSFS